MSPVPTERLDLDLRELRVEIREARSDFHDFRGRTDTSLSVIKWGVRIVAPPLLALWVPMIGLIWYAAKLDSRVEQIDSRVARIEASVDRLVKALDQKTATVTANAPSSR